MLLEHGTTVVVLAVEVRERVEVVKNDTSVATVVVIDISTSRVVDTDTSLVTVVSCGRGSPQAYAPARTGAAVL